MRPMRPLPPPHPSLPLPLFLSLSFFPRSGTSSEYRMEFITDRIYALDKVTNHYLLTH